jgi:predicted DNA-binding WGR domain protein
MLNPRAISQRPAQRDPQIDNSIVERSLRRGGIAAWTRFSTLAHQRTSGALHCRDWQNTFGDWSLTREWGRIGSPGRVAIKSFATEKEAREAESQTAHARTRPASSCGLSTKARSTTARSPISSVSPWTSPDFRHRTRAASHAKHAAAAETLIMIAADPRHLGARIDLTFRPGLVALSDFATVSAQAAVASQYRSCVASRKPISASLVDQRARPLGG